MNDIFSAVNKTVTYRATGTKPLGSSQREIQTDEFT